MAVIFLEGQLNKTLDGVSRDIDGIQGILSLTGSLANTLGGSMLDADGLLSYIGSLVKTLEDSGLDAEGITTFTISLLGSLDKTLGDVTKGLEGILGIVSPVGELVKTLGDATLDAEGFLFNPLLDRFGSLDGTLDDVLAFGLGRTVSVGSSTRW